ncbi:MAG TPA: hypothetical protein VHP33_35735 [Polyangiaceae bacterium]|nr:hypothetical protein [Polyangiaceae bacterium]
MAFSGASGACNAEPGTPVDGMETPVAGSAGTPAQAQGGQAGTASTSPTNAGTTATTAGQTSQAGAGVGANAGGSPGTAGTNSVAGSATGGGTNTAGSAGSAGSASTAGAAGSVNVPNNCGLPAVVSYQKDVQPFLIKGCGGGNGCHVIDAQSTMANGGFNHGYDWITAGSHASSCPETPNPKRFEIVLDVIAGANPKSCSKSRKMPPPNATGAGVRTPLTECEVAALRAWLAEPMVMQMHRADDSSPTTPYLMPPFN